MNHTLPPMPATISALPVDDRGFPVPWFVAWIDGKPDFRVADPRKLSLALRGRKCWICGQNLGLRLAFPIGPMCAINRISAEPPSHRECAEFSAKACPFLTQPRMRRNDKDIPANTTDPAGLMIKRNPGCVLIWITEEYRMISDGNGGYLFRVGSPIETIWLAEGRTATREEVLNSINSGLPILKEDARAEGPMAVIQLDRMYEAALRLLPEEGSQNANAY